MRLIQCWLIIFLVAVSALASARLAPALTLRASLDRTKYVKGQGVILSLAMTNHTGNRLIIGSSAFEDSAFHISVLDRLGNEVPLTAEGTSVFTPPTVVFSNRSIIIEPSKTLTYEYDLPALFDLSQPGLYVVNVTRSGYIRRILGSGSGSATMRIPLSGGPLVFRITEAAATNIIDVARVWNS